MRPELEWQFGEDDERSTLKTQPRPARRWQPLAVVLMVMLGLGLGVLYNSIPEPPPRPTPAPTLPRPTPPPLQTAFDPSVRFNLLKGTIQREVQALADGDVMTFMSLQDAADSGWYATQRETFEPWGRPAGNDLPYGALYFASDLEGDRFAQGQAWLDIRQYRDGAYFRETRFYRWQDGRWIRTSPLPAFWNDDQSEIITPRFHLQLPSVDKVFATTLADRFEHAYAALCSDLMCPAEMLSPTNPINVVVSPALGRLNGWIDFTGGITLHIPSPRTIGLFDSGDAPNPRDPLTQLAYYRLLDIIVPQLAGGQDRWQSNHNGVLFLEAVAQWEFGRRLGALDTTTYIGKDLLTGRQLTLPKYLWDWPIRDGRRLASPQAQANSVIAYIDQTFGADSVLNFLKALGSARALPQAIEGSLPVDYNSFERQWQEWINQRLHE